MSIVYRGQEVLRLTRVLELAQGKPWIVLKCPNENEVTRHKDLTVFQNNFYLRFPVEGKVKEKDIDLVRPPSFEPSGLKAKTFKEIAKDYALLESFIEYEP